MSHSFVTTGASIMPELLMIANLPMNMVSVAIVNLCSDGLNGNPCMMVTAMFPDWFQPIVCYCLDLQFVGTVNPKVSMTTPSTTSLLLT